MRGPSLGVILFLAVSTGLWAAQSSDAGLRFPVGVERLSTGNSGGIAAAVRISDQALVLTGQIAAREMSSDASREVTGALEELERVLKSSGSTLEQVVRLNAYIVNDEATAAVRTAVAVRFKETPVAFTLVRTPLSQDGALVTLEAIASTTIATEQVKVIGSAAAILPAGAKVFISGQAERGNDLAESVRRTMAGLDRTLTHLGLVKADVVHVKAFIRPFGEHAVARREMAASFDGMPVPPLVLAEWVSELFVEIEMVVAKRPASPGPAEAVSYQVLPWLNRPPRYSHASTVAAGMPLIFIGAVDGGEGEPRAQMKRIFEQLGSTLFEAGSSFRHLVKATYYLSAQTPRALLGDIRGVYFDPARAPAASALGVKSLPRTGSTASIDMIAVPAK